jgi:predicted metal-dependent phosphoesterase TrpH
VAAPPDDARIDLHLHSTASDGSLTAEELVLRAKSLGLSAIAITDHDSVGSVQEAIEAGERHGVEVVPGVEIGIAHDPDRGLIEIDILGYFVDPNDGELVESMRRLQDAKNAKLTGQIAVLAQHGLPIEEAEVLAEAAGDTVRRPHIWKVLHRHHPEFRSQEFFDRTSFGGDWHVSKDYSLALEDCVALIDRVGGIAVLAHPGCYNAVFAKTGELIDPGVDAVVRVCVEAGVRGIEVQYPYHKGRPYRNGETTISMCELGALISHYAALARSHRIVETGGTDFHGASKPDIEVGEVEVPYRLLRLLREAVRR